MADASSADQRPLRMMLTIPEVAAELGCARDTVYALLASGQLPSVLISERLRRVRRTDFMAFVEALPPRARSAKSTSPPDTDGDLYG